MSNIDHNLIPESLASYWMPFTPNRAFKDNPRFIVSADGMYYKDSKGNRIMDATAGLWCVNAGHHREHINKAISAQLEELDFAHSFGMGHPHAFNFANRLIAHFPDPLNRVFFTNSGSESVDTALKIALAYHKSRGEGSRQRLIGRIKGYHGMGFGGVSVGGLINNRKQFGLLLPGTDHICHTHNLEHNAFSRGLPKWGAHLADDLTELVQLHGADSIAAVIVEPVAGAGGVLLPPEGYLQRLREICTTHGILLIFDEVITAFGRLGDSCAANRFGVVPDLMTTAKGITNATVPMGAVLIGDHIYQALMDNSAPGVELFHGYTYSGHPLACAAGMATLDIYEQEHLFAKGREIENHWINEMFKLQDIGKVIDIRSMGIIGAIELESREGAVAARGTEVARACYDKGFMLRNIADTLVFSPPLIISKDEVSALFEAVADAIRAVK